MSNRLLAKEFLGAVWSDAQDESSKFVRKHLGIEIFMAGIAAIGGFFVGPENSLATAIYVAIAAAIAMYVLLFTWKLVSAPFRMYYSEKEAKDAARIEIDSLKGKLRPKLRITYEPRNPWVHKLPHSNIPDFNMPGAPIVQAPSNWFRICVECEDGANARSCRPFLKDVEFETLSGFEQTEYGSSHQLRWAEQATDHYAVRDIRQRERCFVDVISVDPIHNVVHVKWPAGFISNERLFERRGNYRLTICVNSEDAGVAEIRCVLKWTGKWDETEMWREL